MSRIRLNQEYRNKIANRMRVHLEQEHTDEKEKFLQSRENMKPMQDKIWKLAEQVLQRSRISSGVELQCRTKALLTPQPEVVPTK